MKELEEYALFHDGLACVPINGKYGYINTKGEMVIAPQFEEVSVFCCAFL